MTRIDDIRNELLNSCHKDIHLSMKDARVVSIDELPEVELLARIKKAAVRMSHVSVYRKAFHSIRQEGENFNHWVMRFHQNMNICEYRITCSAVGCMYNTNYGDFLVEEVMIANMYNQYSMARIMSNHKVTNMINKKFEIAMTMQQADECVQELSVAASTSNRRSDYKSQQAAASREQCLRSWTWTAKASAVKARRPSAT